MTVWAQRPIEIANLFNPAFCAVILRESVRRYVTISKKPMSYPLIFLILPIVLHEKTRSSLPRNTATKLHSWLQDNLQIIPRLADLQIMYWFSQAAPVAPAC